MTYDYVNEDSHHPSTRQKLRKLPGVKQILHHLGERKRHSKLDEQARVLEERHRRAIEAAATEHDLVRARAERTIFEQDLALIRRKKKEQKRLEEQRKKAEAARAELAEQERQLYEQQLEDERRAEEEQARLEAERRAADERRRARAAEKKAAEQAADAQRKRAVEEEQQQQKAREQAEAQAHTQAQRLASAHPPTSTGAQDNKFHSASGPHVEVHQQYLELHAKLKSLRQQLTAAKQQYPNLKKDLGDFKREVRKRMSQFTEQKDNNKKIFRLVSEAIKKGNTASGPSVDIRNYIVQPLAPTVNPNDNQVPALRVFLLNILAKSAVQQMVVAAGPNPEAADPIGLASITVFNDPDLRWQGFPLSDILLAKLHHTMPVLFGINGDENTNFGRKQLGWAREPHAPEGDWLPEQNATEKWIGIGAGFAACTLRIYKSHNINPLPPQLFWQSAAHLLNTSPSERSQAHFFLLKAFVEFATPKIIAIWGQAGVALVRRAIEGFPSESSAAKGASSLASAAMVVRRDYDLVI